MAELINITFNACPSNLRLVRRLVQQQVSAQGADHDLTHKLTLVIDEACANVIRHAYEGDLRGTMKLSLRSDNAGQLDFQLRDYAPPIDPQRVKPRDLDECRPGGLGVNIIDSVMDRWKFRAPRSGAGNVLEMRKRIGPGQQVGNKQGQQVGK